LDAIPFILVARVRFALVPLDNETEKVEFDEILLRCNLLIIGYLLDM